MNDRAPRVKGQHAEQVLKLDQKPGESDAAAIARGMLRPSVQAGVTLAHWNTTEAPFELPALINALRDQSRLAVNGDLGRAEAMLISQAHTLDAIFNKMAQVARINLSENLGVADTCLRLGFKAQTQCRATLETLGALKNPPVVIARQANVTSGPQQINNGAPLAREVQFEQSKLLEQANDERLDIAAAIAAVASNSTVEALGPINGSTNSRG